jgi:Domain of unknown function (DUF4430)
VRGLPALLALVLVLASCGGEGGATPSAERSGETAALWVTRDRGAEVLVEERVPAGLDAIDALERHAEVETRYGGRFVQSVNGLDGSLERRQDWFYFLNGIEPGLGGAEIELRPGDVLWWDFRAWSGDMAQPIVVGAFPEPFVHGWNGKRRPAVVRGPPELESEAEALLAVLGGADGEGDPNVFELVVEPGADGATLVAERGAANDSPATFTLAGSLTAVRAAAAALAGDPGVVRFRYKARFDEEGSVVE